MIRASHSSEARTTWRAVLESNTRAPRRARHEIAEHLDGELASERTQDAVLLVGELVTNSLLHADSGETHEIVVELVIGLNAVRVMVTDGGSSSMPIIQPLDSKRPGGRGLFLVESLSDRWGMTREGSRETQVWFEMGRRSATAAASPLL
jgi:anti-sigma regulatory factor (Ser/Thr protein kinase)